MKKHPAGQRWIWKTQHKNRNKNILEHSNLTQFGGRLYSSLLHFAIPIRPNVRVIIALHRVLFSQ